MRRIHRKRKNGSVYYQFFMWVLFLVLILVCIFFIFSYRSTCENLEKKLEESDYNILDKMITAVDLSVAHVAQTLDHIASEKAVIDAAVVPGEDQYERNTRLLLFLKKEAENNAPIDDVYFYERTEGFVYTASGEMKRWEQLEEQEILENCFQEGRYLGERESLHGGQLAVHGDTVYLFQHILYRMDQPMATVILKLNVDSLVHTLLKDHMGQEMRVRIRDWQGNTIWDGLNGQESRQGQKRMTLSSGYTGWDYEYGREGNAGLPFSDLAARVLLPLGIFVAIAVLCSYFIVMKLYQPIGRIVSIASEKSSEPKGENEIDYLSQVFESMERDSAQMKEAVRNISGEITERLLSKLIEGQQLDEEELGRTLADLSSPFTLQGRYLIIVCQAFDKNPEKRWDLERSLLWKGMRQLVMQTEFNGFCDVFFWNEKENGVIALRFGDDKSVVQIKEFVNQYREELLAYLKKTPFQTAVGCGKLYHHIFDLFYSYKDACEDARYQNYFLDGQEKNESAVSEGQDDFYVKLNHVSEQIGSGAFTTASDLLTRILEEIAQSEGTPEEQEGRYSQIIDLFVEKILDYKLEINGLLENGREDVYAELTSCADGAAMSEFMMLLKDRVLEQLRQQYECRQYQLVVKAREYMEENYSENTLSLNDIADAVGINAAYLSSLFHEYMKTGVSDYLNSYRIGRAKELLRETNIIIKEIGYKTGFNTIQNFNRVFKKYVGCTPTQYRENSRK